MIIEAERSTDLSYRLISLFTEMDIIHKAVLSMAPREEDVIVTGKKVFFAKTLYDIICLDATVECHDQV